MVVLILLAPAMPVMSQSSCKVGVQAPAVGFWTWAPGSEVKVYVLKNDFKDNELAFLLAPLSTWNAVSDATGSKVKFEYKGTTARPLSCENCLTIRRGLVFDKSKRHLTELTTYSAPRNRTIIWASIVVDPLLATPTTLTNAVAHELGHSFGLLDCYSCKEKSSVMIQFKDVNVSNGMDGPSGCDLAQVKTVYHALAAELRRTPRPKPVVDEGEEPVDDDTPVVIAKP
jgi:hypothetical protein